MLKHIVPILLFALCVAACTEEKQPDPPTPTPEPTPTPTPSDTTKEVIATVDPFTWVSVDALGRTIEPGVGYQTPEVRGERTVGIFYFLWLGCHSYDTGVPYTGDVVTPRPSDTQSPYDIQKLLNANPQNPAYGPEQMFHHWGEPYLGYYVSNDEWVIRKHAQMLTDAGVDAVFFDVTNGFTYMSIVKKLCEVYTQMRKEGSATPQISFIFSANVEGATNSVYKDLYAKKLYKDLWFRWDNRPLLLCNPEEASSVIRTVFTLRHSWFLWNSSEDKWFGNGEDKWPWGGWYPQKPGLHNGENEYASVMVATHPVSNIGRSFDVQTNSQPQSTNSGAGIYFQSQFNYAMKLDPKFMFFTGWNEWVAQRFISKEGGQPMLGRPLPAGGSFFVDQYNHEFSRDIEPLRGDFGDNYYYQLADFIRQFKGTKPLPVYNRTYAIAIDGTMSEWKPVASAYADDKGDVAHRSHFGYGSVGQLVNQTGRNDIIQAKVATDGKNLYFYVKTAAALTSYKDKNWMRLLLSVKGSTTPAWEGFQYIVNRNPSESQTSLDVCTGGWNWRNQEAIPYKVNGSEMELSIPLASLGIKTANQFTVDFKWVDNALSTGEIQECLTDGDAAPNGRFRYRYQFQK
ncbi:MAG: hypothetical protein PHV49_07265 [Alistipes sp.]|nr:hypothetical protein [Alistipes sp.]